MYISSSISGNGDGDLRQEVCSAYLTSPAIFSHLFYHFSAESEICDAVHSYLKGVS